MQLTGTLGGVNDSFTAPSPPLNCLPIDPVCHNIPYCKRCWNLDTGAWEEKHDDGAKEHLFAHMFVYRCLYLCLSKCIFVCECQTSGELAAKHRTCITFAARI